MNNLGFGLGLGSSISHVSVVCRERWQAADADDGSVVIDVTDSHYHCDVTWPWRHTGVTCRHLYTRHRTRPICKYCRYYYYEIKM